MATGTDALVWGAGGHGKVAADLARALGFNVRGFADADEARFGTVADPTGVRVIAREREIERWLESHPRGVLILGVGDNQTRLSGSEGFPDDRMPFLVHDSATRGTGVQIGSGSVAFAGAVLNSGARIGVAAIINTGAIVEHDAILGDGAHLSPGAVLAGGAFVGRLAWIGANATILPGVHIGNGAAVGAGAVVVEDVPEGVTVVGNPARILR